MERSAKALVGSPTKSDVEPSLEEFKPGPDETNSLQQVTRYGEALRIAPVIFAVFLIFALYTIFVGFHCLRHISVEPNRTHNQLVRSWIEFIVFHVFFILFSCSYILVVITCPGTIPNSEAWSSLSNNDTFRAEKKVGGQPRFCKWCGKYKPDRTHHCRQCRRCVLKMDHHCPWIYNCVGWGNHKYFVLTLFYGFLTCFFISAAQLNSTISAFSKSNTRFEVMLLLLFGEVLSSFIGLLFFGFFCFHLFLISQNLTNIEFCEKQYRSQGISKNPFNCGIAKNFKEVFGPNWLLCVIPVDNRLGDGIHFPVHSSPEHLLTEE